jgi:hypothetical protein
MSAPEWRCWNAAMAWETQAIGRRGAFARKSAPRHRDFRAEKEEVTKK